MSKAGIAVGVSLLVVGGCEHGPPVTTPPLPQPASASAWLSPGAQAQLQDRIDLGALDRLLTTLSSEERQRLLATFEDAEWSASGRTDVETRGVSIVVRFSDPERQRLLEHVWAPFWSHLPPAVLADPAYPLPGRRLAEIRRTDSVLAVSKEGDP